MQERTEVNQTCFAMDSTFTDNLTKPWVKVV
jgi:hypothetical protein